LQDGTDKASLAYAITVIDSSGKTQSGTIQKGGGTFTSSPISLGLCTITVEGRQDGFPISEGTTSVEIKPGQNAASVTTNLIGFFEDFGAGAVISKSFRVSTAEAWNNAVSAISSGGNDKNYIINIQSDYTVAGSFSTFGEDTTGIKVSLRGPGKTLTLSDDEGYLIDIHANQTVILRNLTLKGTNSNIRSLVNVYGIFTMQSGTISDNTVTQGGSSGGVSVGAGGTFTMNGGTISDNTAPHGGGVSVNGSDSGPKGTFTMNGGTISGNTTTDGGGVYVGVYGTFTMKGGEISDNTASTNGGGVYVDGSNYSACGTFHIVTGTIYGSNEAVGLQNTANQGGAALYVTYGEAQIGTFDADGTEWYPQTPDLATTDDTIRVRNGETQ
jgi:hypothetical protein